MRIEAGTRLGRWWAATMGADAAAPMFAAEAIAYGPELKVWYDGRLKLHTDALGKPLGLFDVRSDRGELRNLVARVDSMVVAALRQQLLDWNDEALANAPAPAEPGSLSEEMREGLKSLGYVE